MKFPCNVIFYLRMLDIVKWFIQYVADIKQELKVLIMLRMSSPVWCALDEDQHCYCIHVITPV